MQTLQERFFKKVEMIPFHSCWEWIGAKLKDGYGVIGANGNRAKPAHIVSYEMKHGLVEGGLEIDHICRNPGCVRPEHLEAVTHRENVLRGFGPTAINARKSHCKYGHEFTKENTYVHPKRGYRHCKVCDKISHLTRRR